MEPSSTMPAIPHRKLVPARPWPTSMLAAVPRLLYHVAQAAPLDAGYLRPQCLAPTSTRPVPQRPSSTPARSSALESAGVRSSQTCADQQVTGSRRGACSSRGAAWPTRCRGLQPTGVDQNLLRPRSCTYRTLVETGAPPHRPTANSASAEISSSFLQEKRSSDRHPYASHMPLWGTTLSSQSTPPNGAQHGAVKQLGRRVDLDHGPDAATVGEDAFPCAALHREVKHDLGVVLQ
jgi:hypothetical protein